MVVKIGDFLKRGKFTSMKKINLLKVGFKSRKMCALVFVSQKLSQIIKKPYLFCSQRMIHEESQHSREPVHKKAADELGIVGH